MSISSETTKSGPYLGDGVTVNFPITFSVSATTDVEVVRTPVATGIDEVITTGFTVDIDTPQVTFDTAPTSAYKITPRVGTPYKQLKDFVSFGGVQADQVEDMGDILTRQNLRQKEVLDRTIRSSTTETADLTFPVSSANKYIGWNSDGDALENKSLVSTGDITEITTGDANKLVYINSTGDNFSYTTDTTVKTDDSSLSGNSWFLDEDDMSSNDATKTASQQSIKAYIDSFRFNDRGDPSDYDFKIGDFTTDGTWRDLDLSSIVGTGNRLVSIRILLLDDAVGSNIQFRENGNSNIYNTGSVTTQVANQNISSDILVMTDSSGVIEYSATNTTFTAISLVVKGWWKV